MSNPKYADDRPIIKKGTTTMKNSKATGESEQINPFQFDATPTDSKTRKLAFTDVLNSTSNARAHELMTVKCNTPELKAQANEMLNGDPSVLVQLINNVFGEETIKTDAAVLDGCDNDQLKKMLESRRSERSTSKKKGIKSSAIICKSYISSMYAELMIRVQLNAPYTGSNASGSDVDVSDLDAINSKIKSLQSKKCRLNKLAAYDETARAELAETEAEIERLSAYRPTTVNRAKVVIKSDQLKALRDELSKVDVSSLPEAEQARFLDLMAKLG